MSRRTRINNWQAWRVGLLLLAGLLLVGLPAQAQSIKVTSAVPDTAEQGTVGLVVTIGGENFTSGAKVNFFVTGTNNPGGIAVKNVRFKDSKNLEATIDVAPDAQTQLSFDIQVRSASRTGKGTELFRVLAKVTGGDTTPPGTVTDLRAVEVGFNTSFFSWTAPADDGYLPASGPAVKYDLRIRRGSSAETPNCGPYTATVWTDSLDDDPCYVGHLTGSAGLPGATETTIYPEPALAPNTEYWAMVRTIDDAPPTGNWSSMSEDLLYQLSFITGPFPPPPATTPWNAGIVDVCRDSDACPTSFLSRPRFDFDAAGNPTVLYGKKSVPTLATWTGGGWQIETVAALIHTGSEVYDIAFDPSGVASIASDTGSGLAFYRRSGGTSEPWDAETVTTGFIRSTVLRFNPVDSIPTIAYVVHKGSRYTLRLAEKRNGSWTSQDVVSNAWRTEGLAFDSEGNPAVTFLQELNGGNRFGFARRVSGVWNVEFPDAGPGLPSDWANNATTAFDPIRGDFSVACKFKGPNYRNPVRFCERTAGTWTCQTVDEAYLISGPSLAIAGDGTAYLSYASRPTLFGAVRRPGETAWTREYVDWNANGSPDLRLGPDGQPGVAYGGAHDGSGMGPYEPVCFARRTAQ